MLELMRTYEMVAATAYQRLVNVMIEPWNAKKRRRVKQVIGRTFSAAVDDGIRGYASSSITHFYSICT